LLPFACCCSVSRITGPFDRFFNGGGVTINGMVSG
jgi:hypothetical protein